MALINPPSIYQVFYYSQTQSRLNTDPIQPSDPSKDWRMYVVVAPPGQSTKITCCPIQDSHRGIGLTEVELVTSSYTFITKDSKILCHEIYTLQQQYFIKYLGGLRHPEQDKIKLALKSYLRN